jgi:hypothetical protein
VRRRRRVGAGSIRIVTRAAIATVEDLQSATSNVSGRRRGGARRRRLPSSHSTDDRKSRIVG